MKLGIIGCGNIAGFHLPVMRKAGFKISVVAGRPGGVDTVKKFVKTHKLKKYFDDPYQLIESNLWDALLICCPIRDTISYLKKAKKFNKPILSEKPISDNYKELKNLINYNNVRVAFNRRFYKTAEYAKKFVLENEQCLIKVSIPESSENKNEEFPFRLPLNSYINSVHVFDLLNYLAGEIKWNFIKKINDKKKYISISAMGTSKKNHTILLDNTFNSPENFSINIVASNKRCELLPIEIVRFYKGMIKEQISKDKPIRLYKPNLTFEHIEGLKSKYKPGFLNQALDFMEFCKGRKSNAATVKDTYQTLRTVQSLID